LVLYFGLHLAQSRCKIVSTNKHIYADICYDG
jgi:hypothetical protein